MKIKFKIGKKISIDGIRVDEVAEGEVVDLPTIVAQRQIRKGHAEEFVEKPKVEEQKVETPEDKAVEVETQAVKKSPAKKATTRRKAAPKNK